MIHSYTDLIPYGEKIEFQGNRSGFKSNNLSNEKLYKAYKCKGHCCYLFLNLNIRHWYLITLITFAHKCSCWNPICRLGSQVLPNCVGFPHSGLFQENFLKPVFFPPMI